MTPVLPQSLPAPNKKDSAGNSPECPPHQRCQNQPRVRWSRRGIAEDITGELEEYKRNTSGIQADNERGPPLFLACRWLVPGLHLPAPRLPHVDAGGPWRPPMLPPDEVPREAFGVRPACWRCRKAWGSSKAGASSTHSKRFAQFACGFAALRLCVGSPALFGFSSPACSTRLPAPSGTVAHRKPAADSQAGAEPVQAGRFGQFARRQCCRR